MPKDDKALKKDKTRPGQAEKEAAPHGDDDGTESRGQTLQEKLDTADASKKLWEQVEKAFDTLARRMGGKEAENGARFDRHDRRISDLEHEKTLRGLPMITMLAAVMFLGLFAVVTYFLYELPIVQAVLIFWMCFAPFAAFVAFVAPVATEKWAKASVEWRGAKREKELIDADAQREQERRSFENYEEIRRGIPLAARDSEQEGDEEEPPEEN